MAKFMVLSDSEIKARIMRFFDSTRKVFPLTELKKILPKMTRISVPLVRIYLQQLVNDELLETAKLSGCTCYWSFPGNVLKTISKEVDELETKLLKSDYKTNSMLRSLEETKAKKNDEKAIDAIIQDNEKLLEKKSKIELKIQNSEVFDEAGAKNQLEKNLQLFESANRLANRDFSLEIWCKNKFPEPANAVDENCVPDDFDEWDRHSFGCKAI